MLEDRMKVKLMDQNETTRGGTKWGMNITVNAAPGKMELCSNTVIHYYEDPLLAVLMNPVHGNFGNPVARRFVPHGKVITDGVKSGCKRGTTKEIIKLPVPTTAQKVAFGIMCALEVYQEHTFVNWSENWLLGTGRSAADAAADAAAYAAAAASATSAAAAASAAAYASAAYAAYAAAYASAAYATSAAAAASAASAASAAASAGKKINFVRIAHQAMNIPKTRKS